MTRLQWDVNTPRLDGGVDQGVLYLEEGAIPWNGLVQVTENDSAVLTATQYDGRNFRMVEKIGNFSAQIDAFTFPEEFESYAGLDGYLDRQRRKSFGLSYRTGSEGQRQVHLVWNAQVLPLVRSHVTVSASPTMETLAWILQTTPEKVPGGIPSAHILVDLQEVRYEDAWNELEDILYGTASSAPQLPTPTEVVELFESYVVFRVVYNEDGTWTATGPDEWITVHGDGMYEISSPTAFQLDAYTHTLSSY